MYTRSCISPKLCSQPDCLADTDLERQSPVFPAKAAGLFHEHRGTSERVISVRILEYSFKFITRCARWLCNGSANMQPAIHSWWLRPRAVELVANKVSNGEGTRKVKHACHF